MLLALLFAIFLVGSTVETSFEENNLPLTPLAARLPPVPPHYQRYFAGDDLIVVNTRTNRVVAIVPNVWR